MWPCLFVGRSAERGEEFGDGKEKSEGELMVGFCFFFCKGGGKQLVLVLPRERSGSGLCLAKRGGAGREVVCREDEVMAE